MISNFSWVSAPPEQAQGVLISDVDSTFLRQEVIELLADHAGVRTEVEQITERAMRGELDFSASLQERVRLLQGLDASILHDVATQLVLTAGAREMVAAAREAGWLVALVSGGFHEVIDGLAEDVGVHAVLANRLALTPEGNLAGAPEGPIIDGIAKRQALRDLRSVASVPPERSIAVGDGANDALMVADAGVGVAFCAKPALTEVADLSITTPDLHLAWQLAMTRIASTAHSRAATGCAPTTTADAL